MPRQPRFFAPDVPLHVIQRGNDRQSIFRDPDDRLRYLDLFRRAVLRHRVSVHAYVLMTNHVHFLLTPSERDGVSDLMQSIGRVYVQWFNGRYRRTGTLWEGRYKATVVEDERYLLTHALHRTQSSPGEDGEDAGRASVVELRDERVWRGVGLGRAARGLPRAWLYPR